MKKKLTLIILIIPILPKMLCPQTLSLDQAIELAKAQNPELKVARLQLKRIGLTIPQAKAAMLPQINIIADQTQQETFETKFTTTFTGIETDLVRVERDRHDMKATFDQKIYDPTFKHHMESVRANYNAAIDNFNKQKHDITYETSVAYYNLIKSYHLKTATQKDVTELKKYLVELQKKLELKFEEKQKLITLQLTLQNKKQILYEYNKGYYSRQIALNRILGLPINYKLELIAIDQLNNNKIKIKKRKNFKKSYTDLKKTLMQFEYTKYNIYTKKFIHNSLDFYFNASIGTKYYCAYKNNLKNDDKNILAQTLALQAVNKTKPVKLCLFKPIKQKLLTNNYFAKPKLKTRMSIFQERPLLNTFNEDSSDLLNIAWATRTDVKQLLNTRKSLQKEKQSLKNGYYPTFSFQGSWGYLNEDHFIADRNDEYWMINVRGILNIFDGFARKLEIKKTGFKIKEIKQELINLENQIQAEIDEAVFYLKTAKTTYENAKQNLQTATENLENTQEKFRLKHVTKENILSAKLTYNESQMQYIQAKIDLLLAKVRYQYVLGK